MNWDDTELIKKKRQKANEFQKKYDLENPEAKDKREEFARRLFKDLYGTLDSRKNREEQ